MWVLWLVGMDGEFDAMYSTSGRRSVPPETLLKTTALKTTVLMVMYSMRSERAFCERLNYDMLFKWFRDQAIDTKAFDATTFTKNRQRLLDHEIADRFFAAVVTQATGFAERGCATDMLARLPTTKRRRTVAADKNYDTKDFEAEARELAFTPHVAPNTTNRRSAIDGRTTRHAVSQRIRKRVEEPFARTKTVRAGPKVRYIGQQPNRAWLKAETAVYNLITICTLDTATT